MTRAEFETVLGKVGFRDIRVYEAGEDPGVGLEKMSSPIRYSSATPRPPGPANGTMEGLTDDRCREV
jgi:hypothetical protein